MKEKWSRSQRAAYMMAQLINHPAQVFSLGDFAREMDVARSTVSDDVSLMKDVIHHMGVGVLETLTGAAGGVRFSPRPSRAQQDMIQVELIQELSQPSRVLPGGFLYMTDLIFSPRWAEAFGVYFATLFEAVDPDYVVTIETKGIPLALMTARALARPLVIIRRNSRVTEGSSVSISYVSGSSSLIQTMSLPRRALPAGSRVAVVDDFMRGGGTVAGARDLLAEFDVEIVEVGVVASTRAPEAKRYQGYHALVEIDFSGDGEAPRVYSVAQELSEDGLTD